MADANGSGDPTPQEDDGPIQRSPGVQEVVDQWFSEDPEPTTEQGGRGW